MDRPLVSIVIVTWNRKEEVLETVQSIYDQAYQNYEIIVVDNGSTDGTVETLRQAYPAVRLIVLDRNMGVSAGRNPGLAAAQGEIIFILDSDASLGHSTLPQIARKFQAEPGVGIIGCKVLNAYTKELDRIGGWIYTEKDKADQDLEFLSYSFSSCGCAIRRKVIDKVGLLWDLLFFRRAEDDFSLRAWDAGYKVLYWPEAIVYHRASPQGRLTRSEREYFELRSSLCIYLVRYPWWMLAFFVPLKIGTSLVKGVRKGCLRQMLRALLVVIRQLPSLWKQRQPISNETACLCLKLQREHGSLRWDLVSWFKYKT